MAARGLFRGQPFWARQIRIGSILALLVVLALVSGVQAAEYEGPGHEGMVPLGAGGLVAELAPAVGEGLTHVPLQGIGEDVCRIVLDENGTYEPAVLVWQPGNTTAHVAAEPGTQNVPFRVVSHWEHDLNGACTAEVTTNGTVWHDPRGRPFIEMRVVERHVKFDVEAGSWTPVEAQVFNNGTLPETLNVSLGHMRDDWKIRNSTGVVGVRVDPLETATIGFDLYVPENEPTGTRLLLVDMEGGKSGWTDRATLVLRIKNDERVEQDDTEEDGGPVNWRGSRDAPSEQGERTGQVPAAPAVLAVAMVALLVGLRRRRCR